MKYIYNYNKFFISNHEKSNSKHFCECDYSNDMEACIEHIDETDLEPDNGVIEFLLAYSKSVQVCKMNNVPSVCILMKN
ncbi:MAG: hypothetical protein PHT69_16445 [Bacteroidales bacterium]|nr:hypothetical protein [Bacteroidales bacterium]